MPVLKSFPRFRPFPGIREWEFGRQSLRVNAGFPRSQRCRGWQIPFPFPRSRREWREREWEHIDLKGYYRSRSRVPKRPGTAVTMRKYGRFPIPGVYPYGRPFFGNGSRGWLAKTAKPTGGWKRECPLLMRKIHAARATGDGQGDRLEGRLCPLRVRLRNSLRQRRVRCQRVSVRTMCPPTPVASEDKGDRITPTPYAPKRGAGLR